MRNTACSTGLIMCLNRQLGRVQMHVCLFVLSVIGSHPLTLGMRTFLANPREWARATQIDKQNKRQEVRKPATESLRSQLCIVGFPNGYLWQTLVGLGFIESFLLFKFKTIHTFVRGQSRSALDLTCASSSVFVTSWNTSC